MLTNPASGFSTDGIKYTDFLPSLNLSGDLGGGNVVRFGLAKQLARSTLTDLRNSFAASEDITAGDPTFGFLVGSAGNPRLKPFKATALDVSYEKYFGTRGYFSIAGFYKKLDTYIVPQTIDNFDFSTYATQLGLTVPPSGAIGTFTTSANGSGGNLHGIELAASMPFNLLVPALDGFGATASYSDSPAPCASRTPGPEPQSARVGDRGQRSLARPVEEERQDDAVLREMGLQRFRRAELSLDVHRQRPTTSPAGSQRCATSRALRGSLPK